jgi:hypothetical protein
MIELEHGIELVGEIGFIHVKIVIHEILVKQLLQVDHQVQVVEDEDDDEEDDQYQVHILVYQ